MICPIKSIFFIGLISVSTQIKGPEWHQTYTVRGLLKMPYAELEEPFNAWYDGVSKQSRIDYYGDMVQTFQLTTSDYGTSLKIAPVTTDQTMNVKTCLQINGTESFVIKPQSVLPTLNAFECGGSEIINGQLTEKWQYNETDNNRINRYTVWLYYKNDPDNPAIKIAVPLRYEMKGYNTLFGSHYDHYYLDYDNFDPSPISPEVFQIDPKLKCQGFPGPGDRHIYTFNPIAEFIHPISIKHVSHEFEKFINKHRIQYTDAVEYETRFNTFRHNLRYINSLNRRQLSYTLTVNHLTDRNELELKALRGRQYTTANNNATLYVPASLNNLPPSFDWRLEGAVTPVKDQSVCGSCWSFGTIGAIEGAYFVKHGERVRLSEQALIDCSWGYGNNGCDGGEDFRAYQWAIKHGGVPSEEDYGNYLGQDGYCHADKVKKVAKLQEYYNVTANNPQALKIALIKNGPISVAIDASHKSFAFYANGIYFDSKCGNKLDELDHAVLLVGYGLLNGKEYWLIKNSWSTYWGNDGYVLMSPQNNNCGVMTSPTFVTVE